MEIIKLVQSFSNPFLDRLFQIITMIGEDYFFIIAITFVFWCINKNFGYKLGFTYLLSMLINGAVKDVLKVPRPIGQSGIRSLRIETATGYSFPSGHTQGTATFWTLLMIKARKWWVYIIGSACILLVGLSRIYLGVHTPVDVAGGMLIGICWVFVSNKLFDLAERVEKKGIMLILILPVIIGLFFFSSRDYFKVSGIIASFIIGYIIESSYIMYKPQGEIWKQGVKYVTGIAVLLCMKTFIKHLLPDHGISDFLRYFIMGMWVTVFAPILFKIIFKQDKKLT